MRLVFVKLHNIRSYTSATVSFSSGSMLLSGDIGSGKSTILLAVEFALFGLMSGTLSGNALLRNGKNEGSVELKFTVENREVIIKRTLKRLKDKVVQQSGYIIIEGLKKELTATELKSEVIKLLGYPEELASKSKNMIFRYTVYTPQEEMKQIVLESKDERLETLRRVFGIDKYKRIRENCAIYARELGTRAKFLEGKTIDIEEKGKRLQELKGNLQIAEKRHEELRVVLEETGKKVALAKKKILVNEEQSKLAGELTLHIMHITQTLVDKIAQKEKNSADITKLNKEIERLESEIAPVYENTEKEVKEKAALLKKLEEELEANSKEIGRIKAELDISRMLSQKISSLSQCPTCLQRVEENHKSMIFTREERKSADSGERLQKHLALESTLKEKIGKQRLEMEVLRKKIDQNEVTNLKLNMIAEKRRLASELLLSQTNFKNEVGELNSKKLDMQKKLATINLSDFDTEKKAYEEMLKREQQAAVGLAGNTKEIEGLVREAATGEAELSAKLQIAAELERTRKLRVWLEDNFMNLVAAMERQVMAEVHSEFSTLLTQWFKALIEDELVNVRLDDEFTPIIEQNGYELEVENLSGGEKTALALAYRLALNRVINDIISTIKTKDLIILDEPTDGFSAEQLDKLRDVLEELRIGQVIIVSHEAKVEGFVDNVTRLSKEGHMTTVG